MNTPVDLSNVRQRPWLIDHLPGLSASSGTALYPYVYVGRQLYADIHSISPNPYSIGLVIHEQEHIKRIKTHGVMGWYLKYIWRADFRLEEELIAYGKQFAYLKRLGLSYDLDRCARNLAGPVYGWSTSRDKALAKLRDRWDTAR